MTNPALLVLEDGTTLHGAAFGAEGETFGEMVFNTGMTGYQETLTDPSYCRQIVAMTAPHIGNTGVNDEDPESRRVWVSGYVVREPARMASNWRSRQGFDAYLSEQGVTGIAIRGTRLLTRRVREQGAMRAAISTVESDPGRLLERVLASPGMTGADLARVVSTAEPYTVRPAGPARYRIVAVDLGIKASTPRNLAARRCEVLVVPATATAEQILAASPDGVFFSNGPGDPAAATYAVDAMRGVLDAGVPVFGICLGSQILALALGLRTYKLRYGHRGVNQPVMDLATGRVYITSHNHGFAAALPGTADDIVVTTMSSGAHRCDNDVVVPSPGMAVPAPAAQAPAAQAPDTQTLAPDVTRDADAIWSHLPPQARQPFQTPYGPAVVTHVNLNDGVVEGLRLVERPVFSVQYHPEAAPGPHDAADHFDHFCNMLERTR
ncbi:MAG: glutamine-hydrolyzing carbamoyl-phosphate synthase small subunit [Actinobacteria bacterium]|nr:glutamine-hydrolyzing carbamoyl-phosphate synthase small subunit [Actinomycetota bacterium]